MLVLETSIDIPVPRAQVWAILTDLAAYPEWNPFMRAVQGPLQPGARLQVDLQPPGGRSMRFRPRVLACREGHELRWLGRLGIPGLFDGEHALLLTDAPHGHTRFTQRERFMGLLVAPLRRSLLGATRQGFVAMDEALRQRAMARASAGGPA